MDELRLCHIYLGVDDSSEIIHTAKQGKIFNFGDFK